MRTNQIEYVALPALKPNPRNARSHSKKQIHQIAASIREFGFNSPLIVDEDGVVLIGNGRYHAAVSLGLETVPVIRLGHLTAKQKVAYAVADNRIGMNSSWDDEMLAATFKELDVKDLGFDPEITGFATAEIDLLIDGPTQQLKADPADLVPPLQPIAVSQRGDVWILGEHRLMCADALERASYDELLDGKEARLVFTDPPYNVKINGHVGGLGATKHREFAMASGEKSKAEFEKYLQDAIENMTAVSAEGAIHFICMDWRHVTELLAAGESFYSEVKNICVWVKNNGGMGSLYRSQHEMVVVFKVGTAPHINNVELGRDGRYRTNVWHYAGVNTFRAGRDAELAMHPTVKPVALVIDAIKDCSRRGAIVLDPFSGSGTTIMACQKSGRRARAIDVDPLYVDVAIRRWQNFTGQAAVLELIGTRFDDVAVSRAAADSAA